MKVVVDDREGGAGVVDHLRTIEGVEVVMQRLALGDYLVDDRVLFERKTAADFAISLVDGRLLEQACRLVNVSFRPVFILEGSSSDFADSKVRREAIQGAIVTLTVLLDIPLLRSFDPAETARLIRYTAEQLDRQASGILARPGYRPKGKRKRQLFILQGLPGIGPKRANLLLNAFGSIEAAIKADAEALAEAGLGKKVAESVRQILSENPVMYGTDIGSRKPSHSSLQESAQG